MCISCSLPPALPIAGDTLAYLDRFAGGEEPSQSGAEDSAEAEEASANAVPAYDEVPERAVPLGQLLEAAGYGAEAASLSEEDAAQEVLGVFKDSRKVGHSIGFRLHSSMY